MTNMQPSCSRGRELDRITNNFEGAMGFHQVARWKVASNKETASLEKHVVVDWYQLPQSPRDTTFSVVGRCSKLRQTVLTRVDSSCKDFCRSLASTAVAPSLPCTGSRASAWCLQLERSWTTICTCWVCRRHSSTPTSKRTYSSRWRRAMIPMTKKFLSS